MIKDSLMAYGRVSKLFHWLTAILVIGLFALGFWMVDLNYYSDWYQTAPFYHESFGILLAVIFFFRLVWRLKQKRPVPLESHKSWEIRIATLVKIVLLILLFVVIVSGFFIATADYRAVNVFGIISVPPLFEAFSNQEDIAGVIHYWSTYLLIALVILHAGAALKHHFVDKDKTLKRML